MNHIQLLETATKFYDFMDYWNNAVSPYSCGHNEYQSNLFEAWHWRDVRAEAVLKRNKYRMSNNEKNGLFYYISTNIPERHSKYNFSCDTIDLCLAACTEAMPKQVEELTKNMNVNRCCASFPQVIMLPEPFRSQEIAWLRDCKTQLNEVMIPDLANIVLQMLM